jgi:proteic killer suppression protein
MIKTFADKYTQMLFERKRVLKWKNIEKVAWKTLQYLNRAESLQDLFVVSGLRLEKLIGNRKGQHSIRISKQYRICFWWKNGNAYEVEINKHYE